MASMWTSVYWKRLFEDAVTAASAGALSVLGLDAVNAWSVDWKTVVGVALGSALVAGVKALASKNVGDPQTTSVVK